MQKLFFNPTIPPPQPFCHGGGDFRIASVFLSICLSVCHKAKPFWPQISGLSCHQLSDLLSWLLSLFGLFFGILQNGGCGVVGGGEGCHLTKIKTMKFISRRWMHDNQEENINILVKRYIHLHYSSWIFDFCLLWYYLFSHLSKDFFTFRNNNH